MLKKLLVLVFYLFLLASIAYAADVDFTGNFDDNGRDTDSDGKFNYLDINVGVNVSIAGEYDFYGVIEKDGTNFVAASKTVNLQSGNRNVVLSFSGMKIYKNRVNGPYNLSEIKIGKPSTQETINVLRNAYQTQAYNYDDFQKPTGNAAIYCQNSPCIADSSLISSRDNITGKVEPNAPNTIDGCKDGSAGTYLHDESIENITVSSDSEHFVKGDIVKVDVYVYCYMSQDGLNIAYTNDTDDPLWRVVDYVFCGNNLGLTEFTTYFPLDTISDYHAVRGVFSSPAFPSNINETCIEDGYSSDYADHDDVAFFVYNTRCIDEDGDGYGLYGSELCQYGEMDCNDSNANINPGQTEICDGIDNNCDDIIDGGCDCIDGDTLECGTDIGECKKGWQTCVDGEWGACQGAIFPSQEICDMKDNDCNNDVDEVCDYNVKTLEAGWNLISIPEIYDNALPLSSNIFGNAESFFTLKDGKWHFYENGNSNSNLQQLDESNGFWIKTDEEILIKYPKNISREIIFELTKGWNLIGYPSSNSQNVEDALKGIENFYDKIFSYQNNKWFSYVKSKQSNSLVNIEPGYGYFLYALENLSVIFNGSFHVLKKGKFNLSLTQGWNLVSMPVETESTVSDIFGEVNNNIFSYDSKWIALENNSMMIPGKGYWVWSDSNEIIELEGKKIEPIQINLNEGINLIGLPYLGEFDVSVFDDVKQDIELILVYEDGLWKSYNYNRFSNSLDTIKPGQGIVVIANKDSSLASI